MADRNEYPQNFFSPNKPSTHARDLGWEQGEPKRRLSVVMVQGGLGIGCFRAPWPGVIESVRTTQFVAGGGAGGQNSITLAVAGNNCFAAAADGNTVLDNDVAGTSALTYPTDNLTRQPDGEDRVEFLKGDLIQVGAVAAAAAYGTAETEIIIARRVPQSI